MTETKKNDLKTEGQDTDFLLELAIAKEEARQRPRKELGRRIIFGGTGLTGLIGGALFGTERFGGVASFWGGLAMLLYLFCFALFVDFLALPQGRRHPNFRPFDPAGVFQIWGKFSRENRRYQLVFALLAPLFGFGLSCLI